MLVIDLMMGGDLKHVLFFTFYIPPAVLIPRGERARRFDPARPVCEHHSRRWAGDET